MFVIGPGPTASRLVAVDDAAFVKPVWPCTIPERGSGRSGDVDDVQAVVAVDVRQARRD